MGTTRYDYRMSPATASGGPVVLSKPYWTKVDGNKVIVYVQNGKVPVVKAAPPELVQSLMNNPRIGEVPAELENIVGEFLKNGVTSASP